MIIALARSSSAVVITFAYRCRTEVQNYLRAPAPFLVWWQSPAQVNIFGFTSVANGQGARQRSVAGLGSPQIATPAALLRLPEGAMASGISDRSLRSDQGERSSASPRPSRGRWRTPGS